MARVLEQRTRVLVAGEGTPHVREDVLVAVVVEIGERDAVALLEMAGPGGGRDVDESSPLPIQEHAVGHQHAVRRGSGSQVEIEKAVVVEVAEVRPHRRDHPGHAEHRGPVLERSVSAIAIYAQRLPLRLPAEILASHLVDRAQKGGDEEVLPAVVVVVPEPGREAVGGLAHAALSRHFVEAAIAAIHEQEIAITEVGDVEVGAAVVIDVAPCRALGQRAEAQTRRERRVFEGAVAATAEQLTERELVADEDVQPAIAVVVRPGGDMGAVGRAAESDSIGDVFEQNATLRARAVAQQRVADRGLPAPSHHEQIEAAVVVVVHLGDVEAAELTAQPRLLGDVGEGAVAQVAVEA